MCHIMKCLTILCPYGPNKGQSSNFIVTGWPCKFAEKKKQLEGILSNKMKEKAATDTKNENNNVPTR